MKNGIVTITMVIAVTLWGSAAAGASARVLNLTPATGKGIAVFGDQKEQLGHVHRIKTHGPKAPESPTIKQLRKPKPIKTINKIKKPKKERVQRVL